MSLPTLDLNLLRSLEALLGTASVTRAARQLGLGQPALSKHLERLRQATGDPLLVPSGRGLALTERGRSLRPLVGDAISALERVLSPAGFDPATARASFGLGLNDDVAVPVLGLFARRLREAAPGVDVRVQPLTRESLLALDSGRLELLVMPDLRGVPGFEVLELDRFVVKPVLVDEFVLVSRKRRRFDRAAWARADHVATTPLSESERTALDLSLARDGLQRRVALTVPTFTQAVLAAAQSDLVAMAPRLLVAGLAPWLPTARPPVHFPCPPQVLVWHPRHTASPRHRFVRELFAKVAAQVGAGASARKAAPHGWARASGRQLRR
jgi:DNA-binding transcriptional LysR family regulator